MFTGKTFFTGLVEFITSGPIVAMVWEGKASSRQPEMIGATNPLTAEPGTIRGDFGIILVATSSTAQMPLKPLVEVNLGLRKKNLPAGNPALFPGFNKKRGQSGSGGRGREGSGVSQERGQERI